MDNSGFCYSGISHGVSSYIDSLALNPKYHSLASYLKKLKASDPQLRITEQQASKLESLLKSVNESMSSLNDSNFSVTYDAFINFYKKLNLAHNLLHRYYKSAANLAEGEKEKMNSELEPLKEKSLKYDDLQNQVKELKSKLASNTQNVIQEITKQLKLNSKPKDIKSFTRIISRQTQSFTKQIINEFDLSKSTKKESIIPELKKIINNQIQQKQEEIQQKQEEIDELSNQVDDLKESIIDSLSDDISDDQDKKALQKTIIKQKKQIRQLEKELQDPNRGKDEMDSLLKLYDDLSEQYRKQSDEILEAINSRMLLIAAVEKQNLIIAAYEDQLEKVSNSKKEQSKSPIKETKSVKSPKNSPSKNSINSKTEKEIISLLSKVPISQDEIQSICNSKSPITEKVQQTIDCLTDYSYTNQSLQSSNQKLFAVICGQLKFINNLSNSKNCFEALYSEDSFEEYRGILISQAARIKNFIDTYAKGMSEDSCLFDDLLKSQNSDDLLNNTKKYLNEYAKPQSLESEELFILLLQAISCNDILRKYGDEARKHNSILSQKYKSIKESSDRAKKQYEVQSSSMIQESNSKLHDTIVAAKSILRKSIISDPNQSVEYINCLDELDNVAPIKDNDYIKSLQKQNAKYRKEILELKNNNDVLADQNKNDQELAQNAIQNIQNDLIKKDAQSKLLITKLKQTFKAYQNLKKENQRLSSKLEKVELSRKQFQDEAELSRKQYENEIELSRKQFENQTNSVLEMQNELNSTQEDFKKFIKDANDKMDEFQQVKIIQFKNALNEEIKKNDKMAAEFTEKINELKQSETEALDSAQQISIKYSELYSDYKKLEIDFKALKTRFDSKTETAKRDKAILESQLKAQMLSIQHDARASIEAEKISQCAKMQLFMNEICKFFPEYVNLNSPITEETVFDMLRKMKDKIGEVKKNSSNNKILRDASKILDVKDINSIPPTIESLCIELQDHKEIIKQAEIAQTTIQHFNEWLKRIYMILTDGAFESPSCSQMQKSIEDAVLSSLGKNSVFQRLENLKVEKNLLLRKVQDVKSKNKAKIALRHLMIVTMNIIRMKKISGHMDNIQYSFIQFPKTDSESDVMVPKSPFLNLTYQE